MADQNNQIDEQKKQQQNKKMLLWCILIVVIIIVVCVLMGDKCKMYRLNTETRNALPVGSTTSDSSAAFSTTSSVPARVSAPRVSAPRVSAPRVSAPRVSAPVASTTLSPASSSLSVGNTSSASEVRKELANLFKAYA